ncbi:MAG: magnesium transporter [Spirochaetia bacterium]
MNTTIEYIRDYFGNLSGGDFKRLVNEIPVQDLAEIWDDLSREEAVKIFLQLTMDRKIEMLNALPFNEQEEIIEVLSGENLKLLFAELEPDDIVDLMQRVSPEIRRAVWENLSEESRRETLFLLRFDEDDAAGLMTPRYMAVRSGVTVAQTLNFIRKGSAKVETVYYVYVLDQLKRLIGVVSLRDVLSTADDEIIDTIVERRVVTVREQTDQEEVAKILEDMDLLALPVVDNYNRLLGIITVDDVIDVIREEQTEDMYKMGAMDGRIDRYLDTGILGMVKKRIPWLIILLILGTVTTNVVHRYESLVLGAAFLFIFMPVITQTGGNSGNQSTTLMIRGLARGEIVFAHLGRIFTREIIVGLLLGLGTGIIIFLRSYFLPPDVTFLQAMTVGSALTFVVLFSNIIGALAPLVIHRLGFDPTVMSAPLMATVIDVAGLTIYFETARLILNL